MNIQMGIVGATSTSAIYAWKAALSRESPAGILKAAAKGALSGFTGAYVGGAVSTLFGSGALNVLGGVISGSLSGASSNFVKQVVELAMRKEDDPSDEIFNFEEFFLASATAGLSGGVISRLQNIQGVPVSNWSNPVKEEFAPGNWIMLGKPNFIKWVLSGTANIPALNRVSKGLGQAPGYTLYEDVLSDSLSTTRIVAIPIEKEGGIVAWIIKSMAGQRMVK